MSDLTNATFKYIIAKIVDNALDAAGENDDDFNMGKKLAYFEVLDTIKNELIANDQDLKEYELDENLAEKIIGLIVDDFGILAREMKEQ